MNRDTTLPAQLTQPDPIAEEPASGKFRPLLKLAAGLIVLFALYRFFKR